METKASLTFILVARCLGSSQYLKEKFGMGYTLETKIKAENEKNFFEFMSRAFSNKSTIVESFSNRYVFNIPRDSIKSLANVFGNLEQGEFRTRTSEFIFPPFFLEFP